MLLTVEEVKRLSGPIWFVDTRKKKAYPKGHIPGAISFDNFPYANEDTTTAGLDSVLSDWREMFAKVGISPTQTFVFYDVGMENRAPRPALMLRWLGNPNSYVLHGGLYAWVRAGGALSTDVGTKDCIDPATFPSLFDRSAIATVDDVIQVQQQPRTVLLDVRDEIEYDGRKRMQKNPRIGRIPGAVHIPWHEFGIPVAQVPHGVGRGKYADHIISHFRETEEAQALLERVGIDESSDVIVYCQKCHRASNVYLALKAAGIENVRVYVGSFREWSRRRDLPVEPPRRYVPKRAMAKEGM